MPRVEKKTPSTQSRKAPDAIPILSHCPIGIIERQAFCGKLLVVVAGYLELYAFTNNSYHHLNRKQQPGEKMSVAVEISGK